MPTATVTQRKLKNFETGLDLQIAGFKELPGLLSRTAEYQVVAVTHLQCFKTAKHADTDVVQFMVAKKLTQFEALRKSLVSKFPGTVIPAIPTTVFSVETSNSSENQHMLNSFVKFIAVTPKLASCSIILEFLGANAISAGKFTSGDAEKSFEKVRPKPKRSDIFEDISNEPRDLFGEAVFNDDDDADDLFSPLSATSTKGGHSGKVQLFTTPDLGGGVSEDDDLVLQESISMTKKSSVLRTPGLFEDEDNSDLFRIDDDFEKLFVSSTKDKKRRASDDVDAATPVSPTSPKPKLLPKPGLMAKPSADIPPAKPPKPHNKPSKPSTKPKPIGTAQSVTMGTENSNSSSLSNADALSNSSMKADHSSMDTDDILKYIQANSNSTQDDLDLFS